MPVEALSLRVENFPVILRELAADGVTLGSMIDGGAASGATARQMLEFLPPGETIFAFEPFVGNHRFLDKMDPRIRVVKKALADTDAPMKFRVTSTASEDSDWGRRGMAGYSSVGHLVDKVPEKAVGDFYDVPCVRADAEVGGVASSVGFVKLDLQGGELRALRGMSGFLAEVKLMWIEYLKPDGVLEILEEAGFDVFDTEMLFVGDRTAEHEVAFEVSRTDKVLSTGRSAWYAYRREHWPNYVERFKKEQTRGLVQTDLVCVARSFRPAFDRAMARLSSPAS